MSDLKSRVVIILNDGVIENVYADGDLEYLILDVGTDGLGDDEIMTVQDIDGTKVGCFKYTYPIKRQDKNDLDKEIVDHFFGQVEKIEKEEEEKNAKEGSDSVYGK